jgi:hypothetical protein
MWDPKPFSIYTLCSQEKNYFFNVGFESFCIYDLCSQEKSYAFSMWDKKIFWFKYFNLKEWHSNLFNMEFEAL